MAASATALADLVLGLARDLERKPHVLGDAHVRVERVVLKDHGDVAVLRRDVGHVALADEDATLVDLLEPGEHAERCGLSAAGRADEDEELAIGDVQVELADRRRVGARIDTGCLVVRDGGHYGTWSFHRQVRAGRSEWKPPGSAVGRQVTWL